MAKPKKTISLRMYAKHRGVTLAAVQKAIKTGRIATEADGKIDPVVCDLAWDQATDQAKQRKTVKSKQVQKNAEKFASARATSEDYKAKLAQLRYEQQCGKLVEASIVRKRIFENMRALRESLLNLPNQIGVELASEVDPLKVISLLEREITRCLEEVSSPRLSAAQAGLESLRPESESDESDGIEELPDDG